MKGEGRREVLKLAAAAALGAAGAAGVSAFHVPSSPSRPARQSTSQFDVVGYGADSSGKRDSTAAIQRAIDDAARARGGVVLFPTGTYACRLPLLADRSTGVRLQGMGTETISAERVATLRYTGAGNAFISARSTVGFGLTGLGVTYDNPAFTGIVLDLSGLATENNSAFARVEQCVLEGAGLSGARALICLDRATISTIANCNLASAQVAILGRLAADRYSNAVQIRSCQFINTAMVPIANPGEAWLVEGCTFEGLSGGQAGAISSQLPSRALSVVGCWMGDVAGTIGSAWIEFQGNGLYVAGNLIGGSSGTVAIRCVGGDNAGIDIRGNAFDNHAVGIDLGPGQRGVTIQGNAFSGVAVPVAGRTTPTTTVQLDASPEGAPADRLLGAVQDLDARLRRLESLT
jgi:Pectate lyase superfamily protein